MNNTTTAEKRESRHSPSKANVTMSNVTWVVFLMKIHKRPQRLPAVCKQSEWDTMDRLRPGYHQLIRTGIATEVEAEDWARHQDAAAIDIRN